MLGSMALCRKLCAKIIHYATNKKLTQVHNTTLNWIMFLMCGLTVDFIQAAEVITR